MYWLFCICFQNVFSLTSIVKPQPETCETLAKVRIFYVPSGCVVKRVAERFTIPLLVLYLGHFFTTNDQLYNCNISAFFDKDLLWRKLQNINMKE